jgi:hypothetical protein
MYLVLIISPTLKDAIAVYFACFFYSADKASFCLPRALTVIIATSCDGTSNAIRMAG